MGFASVVYYILVFWTAVHLIHRFSARRSSSTAVLPSIPSTRTHRRLPWTKMENIRITHRLFYLRIETTGFNDLHDSLSLYLAKRTHLSLRRALVLLYDCGSLAGSIGSLAALGLLGVTTYRSLHLLIDSNHVTTNTRLSETGPLLYKRDDGSQGLLTEYPPSERSTPLHIIVSLYLALCCCVDPNTFSLQQSQLPGVTVPLSHLPILLFALFVSQAIHEVGHAITAAL